MTTFKEISVEDYKKLLDDRLHTYAKTFKNNGELLNIYNIDGKSALLKMFIKNIKMLLYINQEMMILKKFL